MTLVRPLDLAPGLGHPAKACLSSLLVLAACGARTDRSNLRATAEGDRTIGAAPLRGTGSNVDAGCKPRIVAGVDGGPFAGRTRFAVIGDYGIAGDNERRVAALVKSWNPDFVITTGDNNYFIGSADTIDDNIGQYYQDFISPYAGKYGCGASENRFFPSLGNHDWDNGDLKPYQDYFALPGNERYYEMLLGHVHLFAVDSDPREPDGVTFDSLQAAWLRSRLAVSPAPWRIVYMHHPPYTSGPHQSTTFMQWPYKAWGADIVFAGHDHDYERLEIDGMPYIVDGLGGASLYTLGPPLTGSLATYTANFGAVLVDADSNNLWSRFFNIEGELIDQMVMNTSR